MRSSLGLTIAVLVVAIVAPTVSMVRDAIAEHTEPLAKRAAVISTTALPRELSWSLEPITFQTDGRPCRLSRMKESAKGMRFRKLEFRNVAFYSPQILPRVVLSLIQHGA